MSDFDELRTRLSRTEMVYVHDKDGEIIALVIPRGGWWQKQLPEAPRDHFGHEHMYPWGEPE